MKKIDSDLLIGYAKLMKMYAEQGDVDAAARALRGAMCVIQEIQLGAVAHSLKIVGEQVDKGEKAA